MDSAILASYMGGCDAYTFRFMDGHYQQEELERSKYYAVYYGLTLHYVDISWGNTVEKYLNSLMRTKIAPVHSIEPQIMQVALQAIRNGRCTVWKNFLICMSQRQTRIFDLREAKSAFSGWTWLSPFFMIESGISTPKKKPRYQTIAGFFYCLEDQMKKKSCHLQVLYYAKVVNKTSTICYKSLKSFGLTD